MIESSDCLTGGCEVTGLVGVVPAAQPIPRVNARFVAIRPGDRDAPGADEFGVAHRNLGGLTGPRPRCVTPLTVAPAACARAGHPEISQGEGGNHLVGKLDTDRGGFVDIDTDDFDGLAHQSHGIGSVAPMKCAVIVNVGDTGAALIGESLEARGYELVRIDRTAAGIAAAPDVELVVSMGSDWSVYWDHIADTVDAESSYVRAQLERGSAVLGICFGGQLLAHALGGNVERATRHEIGWNLVDSMHPAVPNGPWMQWHYDRFISPPDADVLARNGVGDQAFRLGRAVGLQFHPEVDLDVVSYWTTVGAAELERVDINPADLHAQTNANLERARIDVESLVDLVLATVHQ
jgi:GMP synthase-like glutamine amidotransferase